MKRTHALFAFVGLTVLLTAGTAQSLSGSNTVFSDDIVDGQVKFADIKPDAITSSRIRTDAVGASEIRADQVGSSELADNAVGSANIADGAVGSSEIATGAVNGSDVADNTLTNLDVGSGAVRSSELGTITQRTAQDVDIPPNGTGSAFATCLAGEEVLSGGHTSGNLLAPNVSSVRSGDGWFIIHRNNSGINVTITAFVYCLAP